MSSALTSISSTLKKATVAAVTQRDRVSLPVTPCVLDIIQRFMDKMISARRSEAHRERMKSRLEVLRKLVIRRFDEFCRRRLELLVRSGCNNDEMILLQNAVTGTVSFASILGADALVSFMVVWEREELDGHMSRTASHHRFARIILRSLFDFLDAEFIYCFVEVCHRGSTISPSDTAGAQRRPKPKDHLGVSAIDCDRVSLSEFCASLTQVPLLRGAPLTRGAPAVSASRNVVRPLPKRQQPHAPRRTNAVRRKRAADSESDESETSSSSESDSGSDDPSSQSTVRRLANTKTSRLRTTRRPAAKKGACREPPRPEPTKHTCCVCARQVRGWTPSGDCKKYVACCFDNCTKICHLSCADGDSNDDEADNIAWACSACSQPPKELGQLLYEFTRRRLCGGSKHRVLFASLANAK